MAKIKSHQFLEELISRVEQLQQTVNQLREIIKARVQELRPSE